MKLENIYDLIKENPTWGEFLGDMLDIFFPDEHSAYHYLSEGGDECCLDELWGLVGPDYEMPKEFDILIDAYDKYYDKREFDELNKIIESLNP